MTTRRFMATGLAVIMLLGLGGVARAGWWDKAADAKPVDLSRVISSPDAFKGKEVTFDCVFHKVTTFYNAYYTRFVPRDYVNFAVWPAAKKLWHEKDYMESFPFLFLERDHKFYNRLMGMKKYTRLRLSGYVQNSFKNVPWIEIRHVEVLEGALTKDSLRSIVLGDEAAAAEKWDEAVAHWGHAAGENLPADVLASVELKRGRTLHLLGRDKEAKTALARAVENSPGNEEAEELLAEVERSLMPMLPVPAPMAESDAPAKVKPVDPNRYQPAPKAIPAPVAVPAPVKAKPAPEKAEPAPEAPEVVLPEPTPEPAAAPEAPQKKAEPEVVPPAVEKPKEKPEHPAKKPVQEPVPEKRMSGPM